MARTLKKDDSGHNSGMIDRVALKRYVDRVAALMGEQKELAESVKEVCAEADEAGVASKKEIRRLARESLMDQEVLAAQLGRMEVLRHALGGFADTALGTAAIDLDSRRKTEQPGASP